MRISLAALACVALLALPGCRPETRASGDASASGWVVLRGNAGLDATKAKISPRFAIKQVSKRGSELFVEIDLARGAAELRIELDGACRSTLSLAALRGGQTLRHELAPWVRIAEASGPVGFDAPFTIEATAGCPEAARGSIAWRQLSGPPLRALRERARGFSLSARSPTVAELLPASRSPGVIPVSPRTRGEVVLEAVWRATIDGKQQSARYETRRHAADRSRGLSNVAVGATLLLHGGGFRIVAAPRDGKASLLETQGITSFEPKMSGRYVLENREGAKLALRAARYGEAPLDCGRAGCHREITEAAGSSPMTTVLERLLGVIPDERYPGCALACHASGEPGARDGGFVHVASEHDLQVGDLAGWRELPRELRRLGGVGCIGCHGPGAIAESGDHGELLRSDVCAYCHDAPPLYGHVAAWRASKMARSDVEPATRNNPLCARCHTTAGFLAEQGESVAPAAGTGIACAACHAVHPVGQKLSGTRPALLRNSPMPALLADVSLALPSQVCTPCHTPDANRTAGPSSAAIWAGRGGVDPSSGAALVGPASHAGVPRGCIGCHSEGPPELERGKGHAFQARRESCKTCHAAGPPADGGLRSRAEALWAKLVEQRTVLAQDNAASTSSRPLHATGVAAFKDDALGRAAYDVALVLQDRGAADHNLAYARQLLDAAERAMTTKARPKPRTPP
jgi:hypothetical protein